MVQRPCALSPVPCALRPEPCALRPEPCALRPEPCALITFNHLFTIPQGVLAKIRRQSLILEEG